MEVIRKKSERGNTILEFALGFPLVWMLFAGIYQVGYGFYLYDSLMSATANAGELGSKLDYDTGDPSGYTDAIKNMVVYGDTTAGSRPLVPNMTTSKVNVNVTLDSAGIPRYVTVAISNYTIDAIFAKINLSNKPSVTTLYYGRVTCSTC